MWMGDGFELNYMYMAANSFSFLLSLLFLFHFVVRSEAKPFNHPTCHPFDCGKLTNIQFPFSNETNPECGAYAIRCDESIPTIQSGGRSYIVKNISYEDQTIRVQDRKLNYPLESKVCGLLYNLTLPIIGMERRKSPSLIFVNCKGGNHNISSEYWANGFRNFTHCHGSQLFYSYLPENFLDYLFLFGEIEFLVARGNCSVIQFPAFKQDPQFDSHWPGDNLIPMLAFGFLLDWNVSQECHDSFSRGCYCRENKTMDSLGCQGRRSVTARRAKIVAEETHNVEAFLQKYVSLAPKRCTYSDLKKMTNSFGEKCGEGGFGSVFKGKLPNGRLVAVKFLNESKGNGEEFINEVASIGSTSHVNIVRLLGFCYEGTKRALIYEFMPNGSLEKFIFADSATVRDCLGWEKLHEIAVGIAHGLEYLHRGCHMRILHFDIKPHNILLDQDFCPKISDFGLAKLCSTKDSFVSIHGARGTLGYTAPEVCCRNFGGVSYKSDVYSYGMMVLEMVGRRKCLNVGVVNTSEIYFPQWIYKHFAQNCALALQGIITEEDVLTARKMVIVGLWCIQTDPANRPSMSRVVEMLEGTVEVLPMPPDPFLYNRTAEENLSAPQV